MLIDRLARHPARPAAFLPALLAAALLGACTSLSPQAAAKIRALDYLNDDIASLVVAVDLPAPLQPVPEQSALRFDFTSAGRGERHVVAALTLTDPGELAGTLPPPGANRAYYLFGFSEADQAALREAQTWARSLPAGTGNATGAFPVSVAPRFCATEPVDLARARYSVLVALPGATRLEPLIQNGSVEDALAGAPLADC